MRTLIEFIKEALYPHKDASVMPLKHYKFAGVEFSTNEIDDITFSEFCNQLDDSDYILEELKNDEEFMNYYLLEGLWWDFIEHKYDVHTSFWVYPDTFDHIRECYQEDCIYENIGKAMQAFKDEFHATYKHRHGKNEVESPVISEITSFELTNNNKAIVRTKRNLTDDEYYELKKLANKYDCSFLWDEKQKRYMLEETEDAYLQSADGEVYKKAKGILYHVTTKENAEEILKNGLEVRAESKRSIHPPRIYFFTSDSSKDIIKKYGGALNKNDDIVILRIDLNKLSRKLKFFKDDESFVPGANAVFTRWPIPPFCIKKVDNFDKNGKTFVSGLKSFIKKLFT